MKNICSPPALLVASIAAIALVTSGRAAPNPDRDCFFGQTHVHTSWSLDAYVIGNTVTGPAECYEYALGKPIKHPAGYEVKITRPLDFQGVTDHSEYAGMMRLANDPSSPISKLPIAEKLKVRSQADSMKVFQFLIGSLSRNEPIKELDDPEVAGTVWKNNIAIADKYYQPGKFTTFAAYEWTSAPQSRNMHRNVFFRDTKHVPVAPFTAIDSYHPEDLWAWMDGQRKAGNEVLCISHNANLSDGIMFPTEVDNKGRPIDAAWAQERLDNEPLTEIHQLKGTSETHPLLSPADEFANYEIMSFLIGVANSTSKLNGSYAREAYQNGLAMHDTRGYNPYKFGIVAASDSHNTAAAYSQSNYFGGHSFLDATPKARLSGTVEAGMDILKLSTSGLAGVWAEENTRESIFDAMKRKEAFGTSGVHIKVRMFGGWNMDSAVMKDKDWVKKAYASGVPMGGDLPANEGGKAPSFAVWAVKDPDDGNLDRIQIIKGWTQSGQNFEKVYDVAWSGQRKPDPATGKVPAVGSTVDVTKATYTNSIGAAELKAVWTDPEFDPSQHAFYYTRVLQIPTPRWSTYDAVKLHVPPPAGVDASVQERAWTSPIWFTPTPEAAKGAKHGTTVADLKNKGATALGDTELKALVVGKTLKVRNAVTGQQFEITYGTDGKRIINSVDGKPPSGGEMFSVMHGGQAQQYQIKDGHIVTTIGGTPFEVAVYKVGDKYMAARGNEFGFANYEIEPGTE